MGFLSKIFGKSQQTTINSLTQLLDDTGKVSLKHINQIESGAIKGFSFKKTPIGYNISKVNPKTGTEVVFKLDNNGTLMEKGITVGTNNSASFAYSKHRTLYERIFDPATKKQVGIRPTTVYSDFKLPLFQGFNNTRICRTYTNNGWQVAKTTPMNF